MQAAGVGGFHNQQELQHAAAWWCCARMLCTSARVSVAVVHHAMLCLGELCAVSRGAGVNAVVRHESRTCEAVDLKCRHTWAVLVAQNCLHKLT
jgi:hypothetical protein